MWKKFEENVEDALCDSKSIKSLKASKLFELINFLLNNFDLTHPEADKERDKFWET